MTQSNAATSELSTEVRDYSKAEKAKVAEQLLGCLAVQRTYGKQGGDMEVMVKVFLNDLKEFEPEAVVKAMAQWRLKSPEFPTPADIRQLLKPEPVYERSVYISLKDRAKRDPMSMTSDDWKYIKRFEQNAMKGL